MVVPISWEDQHGTPRHQASVCKGKLLQLVVQSVSLDSGGQIEWRVRVILRGTLNGRVSSNSSLSARASCSSFFSSLPISTTFLPPWVTRYDPANCRNTYFLLVVDIITPRRHTKPEQTSDRLLRGNLFPDGRC